MKCKAITNKNGQCSRNETKEGFCIQHYRINLESTQSNIQYAVEDKGEYVVAEVVAEAVAEYADDVTKDEDEYKYVPGETWDSLREREKRLVPNIYGKRQTVKRFFQKHVLFKKLKEPEPRYQYFD